VSYRHDRCSPQTPAKNGRTRKRPPAPLPLRSASARRALPIVVAVGEITVYSTEPCSFCARVKGLLQARGLEFTEVNLSKDPAGRMELVSKTGMMSFPQVLVGDRLVGGFAELQEAAADGRLETLLAA
jgi:glutaredoxin 3